MITSKYKSFFSISLMVIPLLLINFSCTNKKSNELLFDENLDSIPTIKGVSALGQLSPAGDVRKLASPISQFGSFPRVLEVLVKEGDFVKQGSILAIFENNKKLKADLQKLNQLILSNEQEITLKNDQIKRYKSANEKNAYAKVLLNQREDELLKLEKQKIINEAEKKIY